MYWRRLRTAKRRVGAFTYGDVGFGDVGAVSAEEGLREEEEVKEKTMTKVNRGWKVQSKKRDRRV